MARDYNNRRAAYNREVSKLRKQYALEIEQQKQVDTEKEQLERDRITRKRLERQRLKNIRSAQNAIRNEEIRKVRAKEFEEHLRKEQIKRDVWNERMRVARQKAVDILEKEAKFWLTTPEEIEAAFTPEAEQQLWSRPGGKIGARAPCEDAHFWGQESHTWHMDKTYPLMREVLLDRLEEDVYKEANLDFKYWTQERMNEQFELEQKARLRTRVREEGVRALLRKQRDMLLEASANEDDVRKPIPVPSRNFLHNERAIEKEGFEVLIKDPTLFFVFENQDTGPQQQIPERFESDEEGSRASHKGQALGVPIRLRDPLREHSGEHVWPQAVGGLEEEKELSEKEKKQIAKEHNLWAAAHKAERERHEKDGTVPDEVDEDTLGGDVDYDNNEWELERDRVWKRGLDPVKDADIYDLPPAYRYTLDDVKWVQQKLEEKTKSHEQRLEMAVENMKQDVRSSIIMDESNDWTAIPEDSIEAAILDLKPAEILTLSDLDVKFQEEELTDPGLDEACKQVPNLEKEMLRAFLTRDRTVAKAV